MHLCSRAIHFDTRHYLGKLRQLCWPIPDSAIMNDAWMLFSKRTGLEFVMGQTVVIARIVVQSTPSRQLLRHTRQESNRRQTLP